MSRGFIFGCLFALISICFGAIITHALSKQLSDADIRQLKTAGMYLYYMGIPLVMLSLSHKRYQWPGRIYNLFILSGVLFSGSLILYVFTDLHWMVYLTPLGGGCMMISWVYFLLLGIKKVG